MSVVADLHVHTTNSDGTLTLSEIPTVAREAGLDAVAITDHDRFHPDLSEPVTLIDGVTIIHGIELRVETDIGERIDLLGYGVSPTPELTAEVDRLQADRANRAQRMIDRIEEHLNVTLPIEGEEGMGRPNIARAVADHPETEYEYEGVFENIIGHGCPGYVSRSVTTFENGVDLLTDACQIVGLAHPFRYENANAALELTQHLDAVECYYPYGRDDAGATIDLDTHVSEYKLLRTGGTDAHERTLGKAGLPQEEYDQFRQALFSPTK